MNFRYYLREREPLEYDLSDLVAILMKSLLIKKLYYQLELSTHHTFYYYLVLDLKKSWRNIRYVSLTGIVGKRFKVCSSD